MKSKISLIVILLFCSCTTTTLSGYVYDYDTERPIKNVQIDSNENTTKTDSAGYFSIQVKNNKSCKILLRKSGYAAKRINRSPDSLGAFSKRNLSKVRIYLFNKNSDFHQ